MKTLVLVLSLALSAAALAQDEPRESAPPPAAVVRPPALEYLTAPPDQNAKERGRGALLLTIGSVLIPTGISLAGASVLFWDGYNSSCSYGCDHSNSSLAGGMSLTVFGSLFFLGGATMLALGAQKYVEHKKPIPWASANGFHF